MWRNDDGIPDGQTSWKSAASTPREVLWLVLGFSPRAAAPGARCSSVHFLHHLARLACGTSRTSPTHARSWLRPTRSPTSRLECSLPGPQLLPIRELGP